MKTHILHIALLFSTLYILGSCNKDDAPVKGLKEEIIPVKDTLQGVYGSNILLTNDREWYVQGWIYMINASSLRIEPGTIIKVLPDSSLLSGGGIIIVRDSKIVAAGTSGLPIKFHFTDTVQTHWNGVILMGKAPQRKIVRGWERRILPEARELPYGGNMPEDSSGIIDHVEMNFFRPGPHHLPAGILLLGVGNKTRVDHITLHLPGQHIGIKKQVEGYNDL
jgi:hypothetical protein